MLSGSFKKKKIKGSALLKPLMMKRSRSDSEGGGRPELKVEVPVRHNISSCQPRARSPPSLSHPQTSLSLASSDGRAAAPDPAWGSNAVTTQRDSRSDSASSRETWPTQGTSQQDMTGGGQGPEDDEVGEEDGELEEGEQTVVHRVNNSNRIQPRDVMREGLEVMAERMRDQPDELLEELKMDIRDILGSPQRRDEFLLLQRLLRVRRDLTRENLMRAHRIQLEIFVALRTGILAFILPDISVTHTALVEIFFHKRCRNMACQSQLPANECSCECCRSMNGFCNSCMCVACSKFDFESNSLRWIGCDVCLHWTHADCALRAGAFFMGVSSKEKPKLGTSHTGRRSELMFRCRACGNGSELLGWAKDVFRLFASHWDRDTLIRELNYVHRIFHVSDDTRGKHFYWKFEELLEKLQNGMDTNTAIRDIQCFCQEPEVEESKDGDREEKLFDRREVCDRVADIVQEAISKLATVAEEKSSQLKKAQVTLGVRERELDDRKRELAELQVCILALTTMILCAQT